MLQVHPSAVLKFVTVEKMLEDAPPQAKKSWEEQLDYLRLYGCVEHAAWLVRVTLFKDFAEHSFAISWERAKATRVEEGDLSYWVPEAAELADVEYDRWFNGGLIYHPPVGQPDNSLSVEISRQTGGHWSVHT